MAKSKSPAASAAGAGHQDVPASGGEVKVVQKVVKRESGVPSPPSQHHPYVEALIDPRNAQAVRMPDNYKSGTTAMKLVEEYTYGSNGSGALWFGVHPGINKSMLGNVLTVQTTSSGETSIQHNDYAAYTAAHYYGRVLFYTVEITYIGAEQTSAGRLCCVSTVGPTQYLSTDIATVFDDAACVMPASQGMSCIQRPYQEPRMSDVSLVSWGADSLQVMYFAALGLPLSTVVFDVRVTKFVESVPIRTSLMRGMANIEPSVPNALAIAANIGTDQADVVPNTAEGRKMQVSRGRKMADMAWKLLLAAGPSFGIPAGTLGSIASLVNQLSQLRMGK